MHDAGQEVGLVPVGWGDQEGADDLAGKAGRGMGGGGDADGMGDDDHRPRARRHAVEDRLDPDGAIGLLPVGHLDAPRRRQPGLPARLPMLRPGIAKTGDHQDVGVGNFHFTCVSQGPSAQSWARAHPAQHPAEDRVDMLEMVAFVEHRLELGGGEP